MQKLRKFFASTVIAMTVVAMSGAIVPNASAAASAGDLIKKDGLSAVYFLGNDGKRYVFTNQDVYASWYKDFSGVVTVSASELSSYPLGGNVVMRAGTKLVKIVSDPSVYAVEPNGVLRKIQSESQATTLYGASWAKRVVDVADSFFTNYTISSPLAINAIPAGSLVKTSGSSAVYYFDGTNYRSIASEAAAKANGLDLSNTITTANSIVAGGSAITAMESSIAYTAQNSASAVVVGTGTALSVSKSSDTPASMTTPNAVASNFLKFNLTAGTDGDVVVSGITLTAYGLSSATDIKDVTIYDAAGNKLGNTKTSVSSDKTASFNFATPITVAAGTTKVLTVKADIATGTTNGGNYALGIAKASDILAGATSISGSFPVVGNAMSNTASSNVGSVTMGTQSSTGASHSFGEDSVSLIGFDLTASNEAVLVQSLKLKNGGTNSADILSNIKLYADGSEIATGTYADGYVTFAINNFKIAKGDSSSLEVKADLGVGSTGDTVKLYLNSKTDLVMVGQDYGYSIQVSTDTIATASAAATITLTSGDVTFDMDKSATNGTPNTDVKPNTNSVVLATFTMDSKNENATVKSINNFTLTVGTMATGTIKNVQLVDVTTGGIYDLTGSDIVTAGTYTYNMTDEISLVKGVVKKFRVRADIAQNAQNSDVTNGTTIVVSLPSISSNVSITGDVSNADLSTKITPSSLAGSTITVKTASLTVTPTSLVSVTAVGGASNVEIYRAALQAGTADGVKLQSVMLTGSSSTLFNKNNITQLDLYVNGALAKSVSGSSISAGTITFGSLSSVIAANTTVDLSVKATFASTLTAGTFTMSIASATNDVVVRSNTGNKSFTVGGTVTGASRSVAMSANGSLNVSLLTTDAKANTNSILLAGGETVANNYLGEIKFTTANESIKVTKLVLTQGGSARAADLKSVKLYQIVNGVPTLVVEKAVDANGDVTFDPFNVDFAGDQSTSLFISVVAKGINVAGDSASTATIGRTVSYSLGAISAQGDNSGVDVSATTTGTGASKTAVITNAALTSVTNALSNATLVGGNQTIGKYTLVINDGANRKSNNDEYKALLQTLKVTVGSANCTTTNVQLHVDGTSQTANATSFTGGLATWSSSSLASLINGVVGQGAEMNGTVTLVVTADVAYSDNAYVQTKIATLGTATDDIQMNNLTSVYIPGVSSVQGGTLSR
ncbi:MAG: hypothetical protein WCK37_05150 [Candidatus Falkowbacteria bacterium]